MLNYKLYQDNRKDSINKGKWYARAVHNGELNMKQLSLEIEENVSVKESDVYAVIKEMVRVMKRHLQNSEIIVLDDFGRFKIGISTSPAPTAKAFNPIRNIKGSHVLFLPEQKIDRVNNSRTRALLSGLQYRETALNNVVKDEEEESGEENNG